MDESTQDILIRRAMESDYPFLARMMAESDPWKHLEISYDSLLSMVSDPVREVYLAQRDTCILGLVVIEMGGAFTGYIKSICVSKNHRDKGIGRLLMGYAENRVFKDRPNLFLCVSGFNHDAQRFYESLGYHTVGVLEDYLVAGESEVLMRKSIAPINEFR